MYVQKQKQRSEAWNMKVYLIHIVHCFIIVKSTQRENVYSEGQLNTFIKQPNVLLSSVHLHKIWSLNSVQNLGVSKICF